MASESESIPQSPGRLRAFAYVTSEKAPVYRAIMRVFMQSKARFIPHLRPEEVFDAVRVSSRKEMGQAEIETALSKLCEWGHLQTHPDTSEVTTVEDFYKARHVIQITSQGEAAERALELFQSSSTEKGELQNNAVADIQDLLRELKQISEQATPDPGRTHRNLILLGHRFEQLTRPGATIHERLATQNRFTGR